MADDLPEDAHIRASDDERARVVDQLNGACGDGRLTLAEFDERLEKAMKAVTRGDLAAITNDLPGDERSNPLGPLTQDASVAGRDRQLSFHVVGGLRARGRWRIPRELVHISILGRTRLDLSEAELTAPTVTLTLFSVVGGVRVRVPESLALEVEGFSILGGRRISPRARAHPGSPVVRIRAFSILGGVRVRPPRRPAALGEGS